MSRFARLFLAASVVAWLSIPAPAQEWVEVKSPHFSVITDGGEKRGREIALRFEQMRAVFGQLFNRKYVSLPVPLEIVGFRNGKEMRPYVPLFQGKPVEVAGLFEQGEDRSFILIDLSSEAGWEVVFHEYAHQLLNGNFPPTAAWFDEGFAEFLGSMEIDKNSYAVGRAPQGVAYTLQSNRLMPAKQLFAVSRQSETYNKSGDSRHLFYAQSWLTVHYLYDRKKMKETGQYFLLVNNQHVPIEQAVQQAFGMDVKKFDEEIATYLRMNRAVGWKGQLAEQVDMSTFTAAPIAPLDARATLADVKLHSPDHHEEAVKEFEDILKAQPDNATAHRGLGYAYLHQDDFDRAGEHFRQAARLSTTDPRVYYFSALVVARQAMLAGRSPREQLSEMKKDLARAIQLDPNFADAYSILGFANMIEGDSEAAITNCKKAADLSPRTENYSLNLARAYLMANRWADAKPILERLKGSPDRSISVVAEQQLARAERAIAETAAAGRHKVPESYDAPQWRRSKEEIEREPEKPVEAAPDTRPIKYLRGLLVTVDCSQPPSATLRVLAGARTLTMLTPDTRKLILIGPEEFSCGWTNRKVLVNYKPGGKADGDLVSLEVQ
ncbi:MAG: tetratricopeptide repeat protein [Acidobacteriia bacterium]|nr:tetratricopeptide repeat protein [Terriglobia bacterium]